MSKRVSSTYWSGLRSLKRYGPVPMKLASGVAIESLAMITAMPLGSASCASSGAYGWFSTISTPCGPVAFKLASCLATALPRGD